MKCCDFNAGMLRHRVDFERKTLSSDGAGGVIENWVSFRNTMAHVKAMSGNERFASDRKEAQSKWRMTVRYFPGLWETDRISFKGRFYEIKFINNLEMKNRWLAIEVDLGEAT